MFEQQRGGSGLRKREGDVEAGRRARSAPAANRLGRSDICRLAPAAAADVHAGAVGGGYWRAGIAASLSVCVKPTRETNFAPVSVSLAADFAVTIAPV